jgi:uncharacterized membrane protein
VIVLNAQVLKQWNRVGASFWFLPLNMAVGAVLLAGVSVVFDEPVTRWIEQTVGWSFAGGAEGAGSVLRTIAGSMTTIAGVVFSMTLVALSITSSQLGPRLLRTFMRDRPTKVALGTFVATFLYCLLVLQTVREPEEGGFVPHFAVSVGVLLGIFSMGVLIYFIHHVSISIRANEIVARVSAELLEVIDDLFPEQIGDNAPRKHEEPCQDLPRGFDHEARAICACEDGYVQFVDGDALMNAAVRADGILELDRRPGDYVVAGQPLAFAWPAARIPDTLEDKVRSAFALGDERTTGQDVEFSIAQLVEIAVRALSPSMNDPFTAITCLDRLGSALCRLAQRDTPSSCRHDDDQRLRIIAPAVTFAEIADAAFSQVRQHARGNVAVTNRLLDTIALVASCTTRAADREALMRHANMTAAGARDAFAEEEDRRGMEDRFQSVLAALVSPRDGKPFAGR